MKDLIKKFLFVSGAALVGVGVPLTVASANSIPTSSMEPVLLPGDQVMVNKLDRAPGRGDVVVFKDANDWMGDGGRNLLIKRVIGLPEDTVECCSAGALLVNGVEEGTVSRVHDEGEPFIVTVPAGAMFVAGDNRPNSADSRYFLPEGRGMVPMESVVGTAYAVRWPVDRIGSID